MSVAKQKPVVSKDDLKLLTRVAQSYEGREKTRLYAIFVVLKLQRIASEQNLPRKCEGITEESSERELEEALDAMGWRGGL